MIKTLFQLFLAFAKIGFTSFGGTSMIPLIMEEMLSHNWMTADDVANIVAIAEMTPGSLGVNCATFAGTQTAGVDFQHVCQTIFHTEIGNRRFCLIRFYIYIVLEY